MSICSFRSKSRDLLAQNQVVDVYLWGATCLSAALGVRAETCWLRIRLLMFICGEQHVYLQLKE